VKNLDNALKERYLWLGKRVFIIDGSSLSMPDTRENQSRYPQPETQKKGWGFPVMRIVAVFSLATGALVDFITGSLHEGERSLWHRMKKYITEEIYCLRIEVFALKISSLPLFLIIKHFQKKLFVIYTLNAGKLKYFFEI
jgi:hypothetical protein